MVPQGRTMVDNDDIRDLLEIAKIANSVIEYIGIDGMIAREHPLIHDLIEAIYAYDPQGYRLEE